MVAQKKFLEMSSVTVKSVPCNAIKIHLENEGVAEFIVQLKRASRPHTFWLERRVLRTAHNGLFHSEV